MKYFILDKEKDFSSFQAKVPGSEITFEIVNLDDTNYAIFAHQGDSVDECGCFTKNELRTIWTMLSTNG